LGKIPSLNHAETKVKNGIIGKIHEIIVSPDIEYFPPVKPAQIKEVDGFSKLRYEIQKSPKKGDTLERR
jgi:hypothetical protein